MRPIVWASRDAVFELKGLNKVRLPAAEMSMLKYWRVDKTADLPGMNVFFPGVELLFSSNTSPRAGFAKNKKCFGVKLVLDPREPPDDGAGGARILTYVPLAVVVRPAKGQVVEVCHSAAPVLVPEGFVVSKQKSAGFSGRNMKITRTALPFDYAYAVTNFYAQGLSFKDECWVAHLTLPASGRLNRAGRYVVTTRFASMIRLLLLEPLWEDGETKKKVLDAYIRIACMSQTLLNERERLDKVAAATLTRHTDLAQLCGLID